MGTALGSLRGYDVATLRTAINASVGPVPAGGSASRSAVVRVVFASLALALWLATGRAASGPGDGPGDSPRPVELPGATILNAWAGVRVRTMPSMDGGTLGALKTREQVEVLRGPIVAEAISWFEISWHDGRLVGWLPASYLYFEASESREGPQTDAGASLP